MALNLPSSSNLIQAMSSPTHSTFQPGKDGTIIARFVFPQADGKAAAMYFFSPAGFVMPKIYRMGNGVRNLITVGLRSNGPKCYGNLILA